MRCWKLVAFSVMAVSMWAGALLPTSLWSAEPQRLRAGFARADITPQLPTAMAGYYSARLSTETHDPLWCRATVLDDGQQRVAIVALDLISTNDWMTDESRRLIEDQVQIPAANVMISATHSHTGPVLYDPQLTRYQRIAAEESSHQRYMLELPSRIAECVGRAADSLEQVQAFTAVGTETQLAFNRRFFMSDGSLGWNPGKLNPKIVREAGPTDDSLPIIAWMDDQRRVRGALINYAIHLDTVGGTQWSADMPYTLIQGLERVWGSNCHIQYSTGCCGDVNHIDVRSPLPQKGHQEAARIGIRLAAAVLRSWPHMRPVTANRLHVSSKTIALAPAEHSAERAAWAESIAQRAGESRQPPFLEMVEAFRILDNEARGNAPYEVEVQVISLGTELAWVSLPGEVFVQLGLAIKEGSPFQTTSIHELANGSIGYIPTQQAYWQGNYEAISARTAPGSGELLVQAALEQLKDHFLHQSSSENADQ